MIRPLARNTVHRFTLGLAPHERAFMPRDAKGSFLCRANRHGSDVMRTSKWVPAIVGLVLMTTVISRAADTAVTEKYTPGDFTATPSYTPFQNPSAALGALTGDTTFGGLNPFNPPFANDQIVAIGAGGQLTLGLNQAINTNGGFIGVFSNAGLDDVSSDGSGVAGNPAQTLAEAFGETDPEAIVQVSQDGKTFVNLNGGKPITFTNPTNFYLDQPIVNFNQNLGKVIADQSKPFLGKLSDFNGLNYDQIKGVLNGSAGGNWLDLSGTGLSSVLDIRFEVPTGAKYGMIVDSVSGVSGESVKTVPIPKVSIGAFIGALLLMHLIGKKVAWRSN
jgi:hypothetical protein